MARIQYEQWAPGADARAIVHRANVICEDYRSQGYDLTLRQLYYQFVARDILPNTQKSYNKLGSIVNRGRLAGLIDWDYIVDRTRNLRSIGHWRNPGEIMRGAARSFALDKWARQPVRVEVWVEKEALAGVISQVADRLDVPWFSCRGYVSQSELWGAARRVGRHLRDGQRVVILHLGDHDPSGIDMTRDITDRMRLFTQRDWWENNSDDIGYDEDELQTEDGRDAVEQHMREVLGLDWGVDPVEVRRIALNFDQVQRYEPPPNPAKMTDSRANDYIAIHGRQSWELDALEPAVLAALIEDHVLGERDVDEWDTVISQERLHVDLLERAADRWGEVATFLQGAAS